LPATAPSPCASAGPSQSSSPWTPVTPRKRKRGITATCQIQYYLSRKPECSLKN
jgi:hypothetical protein